MEFRRSSSASQLDELEVAEERGSKPQGVVQGLLNSLASVLQANNRLGVGTPRWKDVDSRLNGLLGGGGAGVRRQALDLEQDQAATSSARRGARKKSLPRRANTELFQQASSSARQQNEPGGQTHAAQERMRGQAGAMLASWLRPRKPGSSSAGTSTSEIKDEDLPALNSSTGALPDLSLIGGSCDDQGSADHRNPNTSQNGPAAADASTAARPSDLPGGGFLRSSSNGLRASLRKLLPRKSQPGNAPVKHAPRRSMTASGLLQQPAQSLNPADQVPEEPGAGEGLKPRAASGSDAVAAYGGHISPGNSKGRAGPSKGKSFADLVAPLGSVLFHSESGRDGRGLLRTTSRMGQQALAQQAQQQQQQGQAQKQALQVLPQAQAQAAAVPAASGTMGQQAAAQEQSLVEPFGSVSMMLQDLLGVDHTSAERHSSSSLAELAAALAPSPSQSPPLPLPGAPEEEEGCFDDLQGHADLLSDLPAAGQDGALLLHPLSPYTNNNSRQQEGMAAWQGQPLAAREATLRAAYASEGGRRYHRSASAGLHLGPQAVATADAAQGAAGVSGLGARSNVVQVMGNLKSLMSARRWVGDSGLCCAGDAKDGRQCVASVLRMIRAFLWPWLLPLS